MVDFIVFMSVVVSFITVVIVSANVLVLSMAVVEAEEHRGVVASPPLSEVISSDEAQKLWKR